MPAVSQKTVTIGFVGLGTVGQGVWKHLARNREVLERRIGASIVLKAAAVRDLSLPRDPSIPKECLTNDPIALARNPEVDVLCELMGGTDLARTLTIEALKAGKTVVSANKALLCQHGPEILQTADEHGGHYFFEASVAGGIPVIKALHEGLVANRFTEIFGILNGTSNYILTRMEKEGLTFESTVSEARRLGYVEADEGLDLDGWDAAHKLVILAYLAHGAWFPLEDLMVEGIRQVGLTDIRAALELGYRVKLIGRIQRDLDSDQVALSVRPTLLPLSSIMAGVHDVYNGISLTGDVAGNTFLMGRGAGQDATSSAVISDIVDAGWALVRGNFGSGVGPSNEGGERCHRADPSAVFSPFYIRLEVRDEPGVLAEIATRTARESISIASVIQRTGSRAGAADLILTTHETNEAAMERCLKMVSELDPILSKPVCFPIFDACE